MDTSTNLEQVIAGEYLSPAWWLSALCWSLSVILLRCLAALIHGMASRTTGRRFKLTALGVVLATSGLVVAFRPQYLVELPFLVGGLGYFALLSLGAHWLGEHLRGVDITPFALFSSCAIACVLLPCLVLAVPEANAIRLLGFEFALALYSYAFETLHGRKRVTRSAALFFLLVNPTLVFPEQGLRVAAPSFTRSAAVRMLEGVVMIVACVLVSQSYPVLTAALHAPAPLGFVAVVATQGVALFLLHSGAASVQIGWMRALGWEVPERYRWAILAGSPLEFWRRWNTYVGAWLRRYVFVPTTLRWQRSHRRIPGSIAQGAALVATFCCAGLAHDFANYPANFMLEMNWTLAFAAAGVWALLWIGTVRAARALARRMRLSFSSPVATTLVASGHALTVCYVFAFGWILSSPGGGRLNPTLGSWTGLAALGF